MKIIKLGIVLFKMHLLSPLSIIRIIRALLKHGINIMVLLDFASHKYSDQIAIIDDERSITYKELYQESKELAIILQETYHFSNGQKMAILCKNHLSMVKYLFALSRLGCDLYLLNAEMKTHQLQRIIATHAFNCLIYDPICEELVNESGYDHVKISSHVSHLSQDYKNIRMKRTSMSQFILLSGGTTGTSKEANHHPSLFNYLNPFYEVVMKLKLLSYETAYIATPIYHAYGLGFLILFTVIGKKMLITQGFKAERAMTLIQQHQADVLLAVPLMIDKIMRLPIQSLTSLKCVVSGAAELNPKLAESVLAALGPILFNFYGTSETGITHIALPQDILYHSATIGRKIKGVQLKILDLDKKECLANQVGEFCIKTSWSMRNTKESWIGTGDFGLIDANGYYFLRGRKDDLIVSGGENVYPIELEQQLIKHPFIADVSVIGIKDELFGQRLKAFVELKEGCDLTEEALHDWLTENVPRYHIPKEIIFLKEIPYTSLGKQDKKQLRNLK